MWKLKYLSIYLYIWQTLILTHDQQVSSFLVRYLHINVHVSFQCVESLTKWSCMLTSLTSILKLSGITTGLSGVFLPTFAVLIRPGTKFAGKILIVLMYALPSSEFLILWFYDFPPWCCYEQFDFHHIFRLELKVYLSYASYFNVQFLFKLLYTVSKLIIVCADFITRLLQKNPTKRLSLVDALAHPWLEESARSAVL